MKPHLKNTQHAQKYPTPTIPKGMLRKKMVDTSTSTSDFKLLYKAIVTKIADM
jgi:hypothetical protein